MNPFLTVHKVNISIFIIWLFIVSALIGMGLGYEDWFVPKTPLNLMIGFLLLIWNTTFETWRVGLAFLVAFLVGMTAEILGVSTGMIFGEYSYGSNLGPKLLEVPYMIGIYWSVLVIVTAMIARQLTTHRLGASVIGAGLMVILDLFIERMAPRFDFWQFVLDPVPLANYIAWFLIAFGLHWFLALLVRKSSTQYAWHLYCSQLVFFIVASYLLK